MEYHFCRQRKGRRAVQVEEALRSRARCRKHVQETRVGIMGMGPGLLWRTWNMLEGRMLLQSGGDLQREVGYQPSSRLVCHSTWTVGTRRGARQQYVAQGYVEVPAVQKGRR